MENLTKRTFFAYAIHSYNNPSCGGVEEFKEDLLRIKYINRLIKKYLSSGELKPRLLLNHLIGLANVFQPEAVARMLFYRIDESGWSALKTCLEYLSLMPDCVISINGHSIMNSDIPRDTHLLASLVTSVELQATKPTK